jgi:hypothetical protein
MSLFYFDVKINDQPWSEEQDGRELPGADEARRSALELIRRQAKGGLPNASRIWIRVRDGSPEPLMNVSFSLAVEDSEDESH